MRPNPFLYTVRQLKPQIRARQKVLKNFTNKIGLAYLGSMHQHDDEYDAIRGFTASTSHRDTHYAVGSYDDIDIRVVDRFDIQKKHGSKAKPESLVVFEFKLTGKDFPHTFFIPTGKPIGASYERVFTANVHMQPLNSALQRTNHSPSFYGKYQILSRPTHASRVASLLTSPVIFGIGDKLWPCGVEIYKDRLYIYISEQLLSNDELDKIFVSGMWLTKELLDIEDLE